MRSAGLLVSVLATSASYSTEGMSDIYYCGTDSSAVHDTLQPFAIDAMQKLLD